MQLLSFLLRFTDLLVQVSCTAVCTDLDLAAGRSTPHDQTMVQRRCIATSHPAYCK